MKALRSFLIFSFFSSLLVVSCKKKDIITTDANDPIPKEIIDKIKAQGFSTTDIRKVDSGYVVEGDIYLAAKDLDKYKVDHKLRVANSEQFRTTNILNAPRVITISISGFSGSTFSDALDVAISRYNDLGLRIYFHRVESSISQMKIECDNNLGSNILGQSGGFPVNGNLGTAPIKLNQSAIGPYASVNYIATIIAHEIGHCIGFRHTDYFNRSYSCGYSNPNDEGPAGVGAVHISGTPSTEDPNSWMLACIGYDVDRPLNSNDIIALQYLYGAGVTEINGLGYIWGELYEGIELGWYTERSVSYTLASPIPESDLFFEWRLVNVSDESPYTRGFFYFGAGFTNGDRSAPLWADNYTTDEVKLQVRIKRISTNTYLTGWYSKSFYSWE